MSPYVVAKPQTFAWSEEGRRVDWLIKKKMYRWDNIAMLLWAVSVLISLALCFSYPYLITAAYEWIRPLPEKERGMWLLEYWETGRIFFFAWIAILACFLRLLSGLVFLGRKKDRVRAEVKEILD